MASLSTTGELLSVMCTIAMVMADAWCWRRTAAPPLRGFRIVGRVSMKRLPQFEVRRWCIYRLMATEVGSPLWWILYGMGAVRGKRALGYRCGKLCCLCGKNLEEGGLKTGYGWCEKVNSHFFLRRSLDADLKRNKKNLDNSNSSKLCGTIRPNEIAKSSN